MQSKWRIDMELEREGDRGGFLGIIFVVHSIQRGDQLVFRYPEVLRSHITQETLRAYTRSHATESGPAATRPGAPARSRSSISRSTTQQSMRRSKSSRGKEGSEESIPPVVNRMCWTGTPYNMSSVVIAPFIMPKRALQNQLLEISIDSTRFIGYPTLLQDPDKAKKNKAKNSSVPSPVASPTPTVNKPASPSTSLSTPPITISTPPMSSTSTPSPSTTSTLSSPSTSTATLNSNSTPTTSAASGSSSSSSSSSSGESGAVHDELTTFNIVFVITEEEARRENGRRYELYKEIVVRLANALKHEQKRCGYLSTEVQTMLAIRERWLWKQTNVKAGETPPDHQQLTDEILNTTTLAHELREIYHGLADEDQARVCINKWVDVHFSLTDYLKHPRNPLRPYHSLILLSNRTTTLKSLPPDSSPTLHTFINSLYSNNQPAKSFQEISVETLIPISQIFRMAAHLVYWQKAKIIKSLTQSSILVVNPEAEFEFLLDQSFAHAFPSFRLPEVLQSFSSPIPLVSHAQKLPPTKQKDFLNIVLWLLRHNLLIELNTYIYLNIPKNAEPTLDGLKGVNPRTSWKKISSDVLSIPPFENDASDGGISDLKIIDDEEENLISEEDHVYPSAPKPLRAYEVKFLEKLNDGSMVYKLFIRLCPYFKGYHSIEEILWRETITREDLQKVMDKYHHLLVTCMHEAPDDHLM